MSPYLQDHTVDSAAEVGAIALAVFAKLLRHRNRKTGECFPSIKTIAKTLGADRKTVLRALDKLETAGWLTIIRCKRRGRRGNNRYIISPRHLAPQTNSVTEGPFSQMNGGGEGPLNGPGEGQEPREDNQVKETKKAAPSSSSKLRFTEADRATAGWMFERIRQINPTHREPNLDDWANTIRLIRERDNRTDDEIRELFQWANGHDFWQANILSPATLRKQWDKLTLQKARNGNGQARNNSPARIR